MRTIVCTLIAAVSCAAAGCMGRVWCEQMWLRNANDSRESGILVLSILALGAFFWGMAHSIIDD